MTITYRHNKRMKKPANNMKIGLNISTTTYVKSVDTSVIAPGRDILVPMLLPTFTLACITK